jgi:hypothetical protein
MVSAGEKHFSRGGFIESIQQTKQGSLPRSGRPKDRVKATGVKIVREAVDYCFVTRFSREVPDNKNRVGRVHTAYSSPSPPK